VITIVLRNIGPGGMPVGNDTAPGFVVEGHAGGGRRGEDIVCAGVSAIVQTAVIAVSQVAGARQEVIQREGYLASRIEPPEDRDAALAVQVILKSMVLGLDEIVSQYPEHVSLSFDTGNQSL
jgi:uncharacterized protein